MLYVNVLQDLSALAKEGCDIDETSNTIRAFYRDRLKDIESREAQAKRERSILQVISSARAHAVAGKYPQALGELKTQLIKAGETSEVRLTLDEIQGRYDRELASRAASRAEDLLAKARASLNAGRLQDATRHITGAKAIETESREVQLAIDKVEQEIRSLAEAQASESEVTVRVVEPKDDEQVPLATLVEASDVPASVAELAPVADMVEEAVAAPVPTPAPVATPSPAGTPTPVPTPSLESVPVPTPAIVADARAPVEKRNLDAEPVSGRRAFVDEQDVPDTKHRVIEATSQWSSVFKPFLIDNVGWFVGAFSVIAGFALLIVTFWSNIEQNRILMNSLVYLSLAVTTGLFFCLAYYMRTKYPQLENSSNVLLVIVTLLIPLVFAAAVLTTLIPVAPAEILVPLKVG